MRSWAIGSLDNLIFLKKTKDESKKLFSKGHGSLEPVLERRKFFFDQIRTEQTLPFNLTEDNITWYKPVVEDGCTVTEARFPSPVASLLPKESKQSRFHLVKPSPSSDPNKKQRIFILMMASTGEAGKKRRLELAKLLAKEHGWASLIVNYAFFGARKPEGQVGTNYRSVSDFLLQVQASIEESVLLSRYILAQDIDNKICFTGFSSGAGMAAVIAGLCLRLNEDGKRLACALYVPTSSAEAICSGKLRVLVNFDALESVERLSRELSLTDFDSLLGMQAKESSQGLSTEEYYVEDRVASLHVLTMKNDLIVPKEYSDHMLALLKQYISSKAEVERKHGGHVYAFAKQISWHTTLIANAIRDAGW